MDYGVLLAYNAYGDVTYNTIYMPDLAEAGVWVYDFTSNGSSPKTINVSHNNVTVGQDAFGGIWGNLLYPQSAVLNIADNTVNAAAGVTGDDDYTYGIYLTSLQNGMGANLTGNIIGSSGGELARGISLWNLPTSSTVAVSGGSIGHSLVGIEVDNIDENFGPATANTTVNVSGVDISGGNVGIVVGDPLSWAGYLAGSVRVNLSGGSINGAATGVLVEQGASAGNFTANLQISGGASIVNGATGLEVDGAGASLVGNTLADTSFSGQSGNYITLADGALNNTEINATGVSFGAAGTIDSVPEGLAVEDKIYHALDQSGLGFIRVMAGEVFVTQASGSIQRGVNAAISGDVVNVGAGSYTGQVTINKSLDLIGAGEDSTTILAPTSGRVTVARPIQAWERRSTRGTTSSAPTPLPGPSTSALPALPSTPPAKRAASPPVIANLSAPSSATWQATARPV